MDSHIVTSVSCAKLRSNWRRQQFYEEPYRGRGFDEAMLVSRTNRFTSPVGLQLQTVSQLDHGA